LLITNTSTFTNTLAYYRICNVFIVQAPVIG
jgi:hypothetical protein